MFNGSKVRFYRQRTGKTQEGLAREVGITSSYLCNIENGKRTPSPKIMDGLANSLSVALEDLLDGNGVVPTIPISPAEKGIVVETGEGICKTRFILPPTRESFELVSRHIVNWKNHIEPRLKNIVDLWEQSSEGEKERIEALLMDKSKI
jgi:transcriptional regulator with XRE-family HTH domain